MQLVITFCDFQLAGREVVSGVQRVLVARVASVSHA